MTLPDPPPTTPEPAAPASSSVARGRAATSMRLGGFLGIPLLSAIAPFITLPVVARIAGEAGWGDISAAQAIGTLGSIAVTFGWGIYGPPAVATTTVVATRQRYYLDSLVVRAITAAIVLPIVLVTTWAVIGTGFVRDSLFLAGSLTLLGLLPSWYCIGVGEPLLMARYDVLPRLAAALVSLPIMLWTQSIWPYPVLTALALVVPLTLFSRRILRGYRRPADDRRPLWARFRQTAATAGIDAAGNAYGSTPVPISTATLPVADASSFGSADRLYRIGLGIVVAALGNAFQGWVLAPDAADRRRRQHLAIAAHAVTGLVGLVFLATLGPWATGIFLGAEVAAERWPSVWFGVAFLFISLSTPLIRNLLIPAGRGKFVLLATIISSVAGLVLMGVGAARRDAAFIAFGMAASEIVLVAVLAAPALRLRPAPPATAGRPAS